MWREGGGGGGGVKILWYNILTPPPIIIKDLYFHNRIQCQLSLITCNSYTSMTKLFHGGQALSNVDEGGGGSKYYGIF